MCAVVSRTCLWHDRTRILTMPIGTAHYDMNDICISITVGLFRLNNYNIPLHKIIDVQYNRGFRQMLVNQGDVVIRWKNARIQTSTIRNIKNPRAVTHLILELSDEAKLRYRRQRGYPLPPPEELYEDDVPY